MLLGEYPLQMKFLPHIYKLIAFKHQQGADHLAGILKGNRSWEHERGLNLEVIFTRDDHLLIGNLRNDLK